MGLIVTSRHTDADLAAWARYEKYDQLLAQDPTLAILEESSRKAMELFVSEGPATISVSWGRDSLVVATIAAKFNIPIPMWRMLHNRGKRSAENPDTDLVRDAFLNKFPNVDYHEFAADQSDGLTQMNAAIGIRRYISGVRADESGVRRTAMRAHGQNSAGSSRPIGWWKSEHVWAYLHKHDLPVHPAYGCTYGGALIRDIVRVHAIGGDGVGAGLGRLRWEQDYYPEVSRVLTDASTG